MLEELAKCKLHGVYLPSPCMGKGRDRRGVKDTDATDHGKIGRKSGKADERSLK